MATTQDGRTLQISTPLAKDHLLANRFRCHEGLNQLFRIELELLHEEPVNGYKPTTVDPKKVLGNPMVLAVLQPGDVKRHFHGICNRFSQGNRDARFTDYRAELVPKVWLLTQVSQSRIFQNKSVIDILKEVLTGFDFSDETQGTFEPRNYCVQYRESDWDFASRLMEEEGIYYYFEHTEDDHRLIFANTPASHRPCPSMSTVTWALERSELEENWIPAIYTWRVDNAVRTGKHELRDFNFQLPQNMLEAKDQSVFDIGGNKQLEVYDWPGGYAKRFDGITQSGGEQAAEVNKLFPERERTVKIRQQEVDVAYKNIIGSGNCSTLTSGYKFTFKDHPVEDNCIDHVLVTVQHEAVQSPAYISEVTVVGGYNVSFACIPHGAGNAPFRPMRKTPKPFVHGSQTAFVVGPAGEEIFTDKYGRVKVQFHWDRQGQMDQSSSCWLRVAQIWAGNGWGSMFIPRIGMEVLIDFLEGDPDQPIIAGSVYNAASMPPYTLPDEKTKSTVKSNSTKGGGGFNEFRIEDKKGSEQIFIHAQKNQDVRVLNDCMETIMRDRHLIVEGEQFEMVKKDKHLHVKYNHNEKIDGTMSLKIGTDLQEKVGSNYALDAGTAVHIKAGATAVIEAGASLTLKVGGSFVNINSGGVFVKGPMVMLNSGGAAGSGAGASPETPKEPKEADKNTAGSRISGRSNPPPPSPPQFAAMTASIQAVRLEDNVPPPPPRTNHAAAEAAEQRADSAKAEAEQLAAEENANDADVVGYSEPNIGNPDVDDDSTPANDQPADSEPPALSEAVPYLESSQNGTPFIGN